MEQKTQVYAKDNEQDILITREFDLSVKTLFKAYVEKDLFEEWMGSDLLEFEFKEYGKTILKSATQKET